MAIQTGQKYNVASGSATGKKAGISTHVGDMALQIFQFYANVEESSLSKR